MTWTRWISMNEHKDRNIKAERFSHGFVRSCPQERIWVKILNYQKTGAKSDLAIYNSLKLYLSPCISNESNLSTQELNKILSWFEEPGQWGRNWGWNF